MSDLDLRASDDERQATVERLAAHYRAGRLSADELEERTATANAATTRGELAALEGDLPAPPAPDTTAVQRRDHVRERVVSAISVSVFLWVIWLATGASGFAWPIIPTAALLLGIVRGEWGGEDDHPRGRRRHGPPRPPRLP